MLTRFFEAFGITCVMGKVEGSHFPLSQTNNGLGDLQQGGR